MREIEEKMTRNSLRPKDPRTRSDRTQRAQDQWNQQYPRLVDSYLMWRHEAWQPTPITNSSPPVVNYDEESSPDPTSDAPSGDGNFSMELVDTFDHNTLQYLFEHLKIIGRHTACVPALVYRQRCASYVMCITNRFIDTYVINSAKHLTYTWKYWPRFGGLAPQECLPLLHVLFRRGTQRADTRSGRASNWLSAEYVDIFKDEVPSRGKSGGMGNPTEAEQGDDNVDEDGAWLDIEVGAEGTESGHFKKTPVDMDSPVADDPLNPCTERCRHGILLLLCDMIQSGARPRPQSHMST